jgi:carboxymethylenebutenolidase
MSQEPDLTAETTTITGAGGDEIEAYVVRVAGDAPRGGVVVIHHMPGWDRETKEFARRFGAMGFDAIAPHLYTREAGKGAEPSDAAAEARARGGVPDERLVGDVEACVAYLKSLPGSNGKVGVIGHCSGGRQSWLAATSLPLDAAVCCYPGFIVGEVPEGFPIKLTPLLDRAPQLSCPLLGLFGNDDQYPSPAHVDEIEAALKEAGKDYEFHRFDGAGHSFFSVDRPAAFRAEQALEGWGHIERFFDTHLGR